MSAEFAYRAALSLRQPGKWMVAETPKGALPAPSSGILDGFATETDAQDAANLLNELRDDGGRADEVLERILTSKGLKTNP